MAATSIEIDGITYQAANSDQLAGLESFVKALQEDDFTVTPSHWVCYHDMPYPRDGHAVISVGNYYWQGPSEHINQFLAGFNMISQQYADLDVQAVRVSSAVVDAVAVKPDNQMVMVNAIKSDPFMNAVRRADVNEVRRLVEMGPLSINSGLGVAMRHYNKSRSHQIVHILIDSGRVAFERLLNAIATAAAENNSIKQSEAIELVQKVVEKTPVDNDVYEVMLRFDKLGWVHLMKVIAALVRTTSS